MGSALQSLSHASLDAHVSSHALTHIDALFQTTARVLRTHHTKFNFWLKNRVYMSMTVNRKEWPGFYLLEPSDIALRFELPDSGFPVLPPDMPLRSCPLEPGAPPEAPLSPLRRVAEDRVPVGLLRPLRLAPSFPVPGARVPAGPDGLLIPLLLDEVPADGLPLVGEAAPADGDERPLRFEERPPVGLLSPPAAAPADGDDRPLRLEERPPVGWPPAAAPADGDDRPLRLDERPPLGFAAVAPADGDERPLRLDGSRPLEPAGLLSDGTSEKLLLSPGSPVNALRAEPRALRANTDSGFELLSLAGRFFRHGMKQQIGIRSSRRSSSHKGLKSLS